MKAHALLTAAAILLLTAGAWSVLRLLTFSKPPPEAKWCEQLSSPDAGDRDQAYDKLGQLWRKKWETDSRGGIERDKLPSDESVLIVMESLRAEASPGVAMSGLASLIYAPVSVDYRPQFEALIESVIMKEMDDRERVWRKSCCALLLWDFDALRGLPPSERAITLVREVLTRDRDPGSALSLLASLREMKGDLLPLKDAIGALQDFPEPNAGNAREWAALMLKQMDTPVTPEERRERMLVPEVQ